MTVALVSERLDTVIVTTIALLTTPSSLSDPLEKNTDTNPVPWSIWDDTY